MEKDRQKSYINVDFFEDLTGEILEPVQKNAEQIGARIRTLREKEGLSLDEISKMTGFDEAFLADIESNKIQPQLGTIIKLSKALHSAFGRLVSGGGDKLYAVTRRNERRTVARSTARKGQRLYTYKDLAPDVKGRHMEALIVRLEENPEKEISVHEGEEFIFVLDGEVLLEIGDDKFELAPGDSAYYLSTTAHVIAAKKDQATILAVLYEG